MNVSSNLAWPLENVITIEMTLGIKITPTPQLMLVHLARMLEVNSPVTEFHQLALWVVIISPSFWNQIFVENMQKL